LAASFTARYWYPMQRRWHSHFAMIAIWITYHLDLDPTLTWRALSKLEMNCFRSSVCTLNVSMTLTSWPEHCDIMCKPTITGKYNTSYTLQIVNYVTVPLNSWPWHCTKTFYMQTWPWHHAIMRMLKASTNIFTSNLPSARL
jgi:hypothetical protein